VQGISFYDSCELELEGADFHPLLNLEQVVLSAIICPRPLPKHLKMRQTVFITGASSGIGQALTLELASKGHALALAARRRDQLENLCAEARRLGVDAIPLTCDVGDQNQVKQAVAETFQYFGRVDLAILSAGIGGTTTVSDFKADKFERLVRTNLLGIAYCLEELIPIMQRQMRALLPPYPVWPATGEFQAQPAIVRPRPDFPPCLTGCASN